MQQWGRDECFHSFSFMESLFYTIINLDYMEVKRFVVVGVILVYVIVLLKALSSFVFPWNIWLGVKPE